MRNSYKRSYTLNLDDCPSASHINNTCNPCSHETAQATVADGHVNHVALHDTAGAEVSDEYLRGVMHLA